MEFISIITLNVNGLNSSTEGHRLAEQIFLKKCIYAAYHRPTSDIGRHTE